MGNLIGILDPVVEVIIGIWVFIGICVFFGKERFSTGLTIFVVDPLGIFGVEVKMVIFLVPFVKAIC